MWRNLDSRMQQMWGFGIRNPERGVGNPLYGIQNSQISMESRIHFCGTSKFGICNQQLGIWDPLFGPRIHGLGSGIQEAPGFLYICPIKHVTLSHDINMWSRITKNGKLFIVLHIFKNWSVIYSFQTLSGKNRTKNSGSISLKDIWICALTLSGQPL